MKKFIQFIVFSLLMVVFTAPTQAQAPKSDQTTVCYKTNMDCHDCEVTLTNYLKFEKGVKDLQVDLKSNTIKVVFKTGKNTPENLANGIKKQGYEANVITEDQQKALVKEASKK
ncbi:MAG: heavy-metal-associated domain-containing protein [Verrucomicrobia bacterium]|nr:heavy-metal-associated domain-containing protein [Prolixibacteraceae bacterium]